MCAARSTVCSASAVCLSRRTPFAQRPYAMEMLAEDAQDWKRLCCDMRTEAVGICLLWGIHLTGLSPPRAVHWRAIEARRLPACLRRRGGHRPGPPSGDEVSVAHRVVSYGAFEHPAEHHPAAPGVASVEPVRLSGHPVSAYADCIMLVLLIRLTQHHTASCRSSGSAASSGRAATGMPPWACGADCGRLSQPDKQNACYVI